MSMKKNTIFCSAVLIGALFATSGECNSGKGWLQGWNGIPGWCLTLDNKGNEMKCNPWTTDTAGQGNCDCTDEQKATHTQEADAAIAAKAKAQAGGGGAAATI